MKKITIAGAGTLGSQISWQTAFAGFDVTVFDVFEKGIERCKELHQSYAQLFLEKKNVPKSKIDETLSRLTYSTNLKEAVKDADLVSESVPENKDIKSSFYKELSKAAPAKTIFTTNSSTLTPGQLVEAVDRPKQFLALHFCVGVWDNNIGEVMGHPGTSKDSYEKVLQFAKDIKMIPIPIHKEQPGYVLNSLLVPFFVAALDLVYREVADFKNVDKTWIIANGKKTIGPFAFMDIVGLTTVYDVCHMQGSLQQNQSLIDMAAYLKSNYLDKGRLGVHAGKGFYDYPNPAYESAGFLA